MNNFSLYHKQKLAAVRRRKNIYNPRVEIIVNKFCPNDGTFLLNHKFTMLERYYCRKCHFYLQVPNKQKT